MRFLKEYISIILIIAIIFGLDYFIGKVTEDSILEIDGKLDNLTSKMENSNENDLKKLAEEFENDWKNTEEKLSYFAEHNELEKVTIDIVSMKAYFEKDNLEEAYKEINEIKYNIEHIKNKQKLKLNNIF